LPGPNPEEYVDCMRGWAETNETHGGTVAANYILVPEEDEDGNKQTPQERQDIARECTIAIALICGADFSMCGTLIADLSNLYTMGKNDYPSG
jgi:hypothetical protein